MLPPKPSQALRQCVADATGQSLDEVPPSRALAHTQSLLTHNYRKILFQLGVVGVSHFEVEKALKLFFPDTTINARRHMRTRWLRALTENGEQRHAVKCNTEEHGPGFVHVVDPPKAKALLGANSQWDKFVARVTDPSGGVMCKHKPAAHVLAYRHAQERYSHALTYKSAHYVAENVRDLLCSEEDAFSVMAIDKIYEGVAVAAPDGTVNFPQESLAEAVRMGLSEDSAKSVVALLGTTVQSLQQTCKDVMLAHAEPACKTAITSRMRVAEPAPEWICDWYGESAFGGWWWWWWW